MPAAAPPSDLPIGTLLTDFYRANNLPEDGGENDRWFYLTFGPVHVPVPNTKGRRAIVYLHDIHHMILGYDTSWKGEAMVSAWEIATGMGKLWTGWLLSASVFVVGVWVFPKATFRAFVQGRRSRGVIALRQSKEALLAQSIPQLRQATGLPALEEATVQASDYLVYAVWALGATLFYGTVWLLPIYGLILIFL